MAATGPQTRSRCERPFARSLHASFPGARSRAHRLDPLDRFLESFGQRRDAVTQLLLGAAGRIGPVVAIDLDYLIGQWWLDPRDVSLQSQRLAGQTHQPEGQMTCRRLDAGQLREQLEQLVIIGIGTAEDVATTRHTALQRE